MSPLVVRLIIPSGWLRAAYARMPFVPPLALRSVAAPRVAKRPQRPATCRLGDKADGDEWPHFSAEEWARLDTLSGFEALCFRTQAALCRATAAADGLGTFDGVPLTASPSLNFDGAPPTTARRKRAAGARRMQGGLAFERAVVNVWRTPSVKGLHGTSAVGLSLRMQPRHSGSPHLRANVNYFENGGVWWVQGGTDLAPGAKTSPNIFARDTRQFLQCVQPAEELPATWDWDVPHAEGPDRLGAFAFVARVVDAVLPAYLPLVAGTEGSIVSAPAPPPPSKEGQARGHARVRYGLAGGASCESEVREHNAALAWWRFTLAPRVGTPQASLYQRMRDASR